jgi:uncharacterized protein (TIRG00374 family)
MIPERRPRHYWLMVGVVIGVTLAGAVIIALDWQQARQVMREANWGFLAPALAATAVSYGCLSYGLYVVFRIFGTRLARRDIIEIGFVSNVLSYLLSVGGTIGISIRFMLMKRRGISAEDILAPSLFHAYFNNLTLFALLPIGLFNILVSHPMSGVERLSAGIGAGLLTVLLALATVIVFTNRVRSRMLHFIARAWHTLSHRDLHGAFDDFNMTLDRGISAIRNRPFLILAPLVLIVGDWAASIAVMWFCFEALGTTVSVGTLVTGFGVGVVVGLLSLIPGGLGVQEASMSAIYAALGVPLQTAILVAVLFRIVYYFVPFAFSLALYRRILSTGDKRSSGL